MEEQREVTFQRALEFAKEYKLHKVFETSAKTGFNVEEVFATVAKELYLQNKRENEQQAASEQNKTSGDGGKGSGNTAPKGSKLNAGKAKATPEKKKGGCC